MTVRTFRRRKTWAGAAVVLSLAAALAGSGAVAPSAGAQPGDWQVQAPSPQPQAFVPPTRVGPFKVGRETLTAVSSDGRRTRTLDVWYPVDRSTRGRPAVYGLDAFPGLSYPSAVALDQVPVALGGPFPLVVYSHGSGGIRFIATFFTEALASHGFVVVSADHTGDTVLDVLAGHPVEPSQEPSVIASRVADVKLAVDTVLTRSATEGDLLAGSVDPERIGITGHSYGGLTAFAAIAGVDPADGPAIPADPRFKAMVTMDPTPRLLAPADVARVAVPTMSIVGGPVEGPWFDLWHYATADPFIQVWLHNAAHLGFTDICHYKELAEHIQNAPAALSFLVNGLAGEACTDAVLPVGRVHQATNLYAIAFLERYLAGDDRYEPYLLATPDGDVTLTRPPRLDSTSTTTTSVPLILD